MFTDRCTDFLDFSDKLNNPQLLGLAQEIPEVLCKARAPNTNKSYGLAFKRWTRWAEEYPEISVLPAQPLHIILFLIFLAKTAKSYSVINIAVCAINWAHNLAGLDSPTRHVLIVETLNGLKRQLARPTIPKEPFEREHIHKLFDILDPGKLTDIRNTLIIVLAYFAFLRVDELRHVCTQHIEINNSHAEITIPKSKCDQLRQGNTVIVARLGGKFCPITLLEKYLQVACAKCKPYKHCTHYVFKKLEVKNKTTHASEKDIPMTYSSIRDVVKKKATQLGLDAKRFGTHSMRAGGATAAANSAVPDRILQKHGRWATASSKDRYVKDSHEQRMQITQMLG